jgi:porin
LAGGGGNETFINTGLAAPINGVTPPYLLGALLSVRTDPAIVGLWIYDPRNAQGSDVIEHPFGDGVTTSLSVTFPTQIGGMSGFYGVRGVYSTQEGFDFRDLPALALPPESATALSTKNKYWFSSVSFQQYLMQSRENPAEGWGIFGQAGISDGNPNAFKWSVVAGLAGTSPLPSRNLDRWGIGYFYYGLSNELKEGLSALGQGVRNEYGVEAFYNLAVAPWFRLTADAQWARPGTVAFSDAIVLGLRAQTRF